MSLLRWKVVRGGVDMSGKQEDRGVIWMRKHERCPYCGSRNIEEVKPNWGICYDCYGNFHMIPLSVKQEKR